jgi:hypothetical protein
MGQGRATGCSLDRSDRGDGLAASQDHVPLGPEFHGAQQLREPSCGFGLDNSLSIVGSSNPTIR